MVKKKQVAIVCFLLTVILSFMMVKEVGFIVAIVVATAFVIIFATVMIAINFIKEEQKAYFRD